MNSKMKNSPFDAEEDISGFQSKEILKNCVKKKIAFHSTLLFALAVLAMIITIGDTQVSGMLEPHKRTRNKSALFRNGTQSLSREYIDLFSKMELLLKSLISFLTLLTCLVLCFLYTKIFQLKVLQNLYPPTMSFCSASELLKVLVVEIIICIAHLPPLVTHYTGVSYRLQVIVFARFYLIARFLKERHQLLHSKSTRFLASVTKTELSPLFLTKTFFMRYPFYIVCCGYLIILFLGGYTIWLIEDKRISYLEVLWMMAITMTTVGFGDYTPKTFLGRTAIGFISLIGILILAIFVSLVNEVLSLQQKEKRILSYVECQEAIRRKKIIALNAIGMWYKYHSYRKKNFYLMDSASHYLLPRANRQLKMQIICHFKSYFLQQKMIKAINLWRSSKECDVRNSFTHEFMIGDINTMVSGLVSNVDYLIKKVDENDKKKPRKTSNLDKSILSLENNRRTKTFTQGSMTTERKVNCDLHQRRRSKCSMEFQDDVIQQAMHHCQEMIPMRRMNSDNDTRMFDMNCERFDMGLPVGKETVEGLNHWNRNQGNTLELTLQLLENQTMIMTNNLIDSYRETKQDIMKVQNVINNVTHFDGMYLKTQKDLYDLHNILQNLQCCFEKEKFV